LKYYFIRSGQIIQYVVSRIIWILWISIYQGIRISSVIIQNRTVVMPRRNEKIYRSYKNFVSPSRWIVNESVAETPTLVDVLMKAIQLVCSRTMEEITESTNLFCTCVPFVSASCDLHSQRSIVRNMRMLYRTDEMCEFNFSVLRAHKYASRSARSFPALWFMRDYAFTGAATDSADRGRSAVSILSGWTGGNDIKGPWKTLIDSRVLPIIRSIGRINLSYGICTSI